MKYPTGEWKMHVGNTLIVVGLAIYISLWMAAFSKFLPSHLNILIFIFSSFLIVYDKEPESFSEESQKAQLKRMLTLEVNPIHGISSQWDYENKRWKK